MSPRRRIFSCHGSRNSQGRAGVPRAHLRRSTATGAPLLLAGRIDVHRTAHHPALAAGQPPPAPNRGAGAGGGARGGGEAGPPPRGRHGRLRNRPSHCRASDGPTRSPHRNPTFAPRLRRGYLTALPRSNPSYGSSAPLPRGLPRSGARPPTFAPSTAVSKRAFSTPPKYQHHGGPTPAYKRPPLSSSAVATRHGPSTRLPVSTSSTLPAQHCSDCRRASRAAAPTTRPTLANFYHPLSRPTSPESSQLRVTARPTSWSSSSVRVCGLWAGAAALRPVPGRPQRQHSSRSRMRSEHFISILTHSLL